MNLELKGIADFLYSSGCSLDTSSLPSIKQHFFHSGESKFSIIQWCLVQIGYLNVRGKSLEEIAAALEDCGAFRGFSPKRILMESPGDGEEEQYVQFWKLLALTVNASTISPRNLAETAYTSLWKQHQDQKPQIITLIPHDIIHDVSKNNSYSKQDSLQALENSAAQAKMQVFTSSSVNGQYPSMLDLYAKLVSVSTELDAQEFSPDQMSIQHLEVGVLGKLIDKVYQGIRSSQDGYSDLGLLKQEALQLL